MIGLVSNVNINGNLMNLSGGSGNEKSQANVNNNGSGGSIEKDNGQNKSNGSRNGSGSGNETGFNNASGSNESISYFLKMLNANPQTQRDQDYQIAVATQQNMFPNQR